MTNQITQTVLQKYKTTYPSWENVRLTETIRVDDNCYYLVVRATENGIETEGEICYIDTDLKVTVFATTEELIRFIENKINKKWHQKVFTKTGISFIVTLILLVTLCILVFRPNQSDPQVLQIIGGAFLAAVGFLFGTSSSSKAS
jgi:hypothetical protein